MEATREKIKRVRRGQRKGGGQEEAAKQNAILKDGAVKGKRWRYREGWREGEERDMWMDEKVSDFSPLQRVQPSQSSNKKKRKEELLLL